MHILNQLQRSELGFWLRADNHWNLEQARHLGGPAAAMACDDDVVSRFVGMRSHYEGLEESNRLDAVRQLLQPRILHALPLVDVIFIVIDPIRPPVAPWLAGIALNQCDWEQHGAGQGAPVVRWWVGCPRDHGRLPQLDNV
jgi:hypothetical protein